MILIEVWRRRLCRRVDAEKVRFFLGLVPDRLALARRYPLWRALSWGRMLFSPRYAKAAGGWLQYRMDLYDGVEG